MARSVVLTDNMTPAVSSTDRGRPQVGVPTHCHERMAGLTNQGAKNPSCIPKISIVRTLGPVN